jgi:hypothetical protein
MSQEQNTKNKKMEQSQLISQIVTHVLKQHQNTLMLEHFEVCQAITFYITKKARWSIRILHAHSRFISPGAVLPSQLTKVTDEQVYTDLTECRPENIFRALWSA